VVQSDKEAVRWWKKAAEQGLANAQFHLGFMFEKGRGVAQSDKEAVRWWKKAADQGDVVAQVNLGLMFCKGRGACLSEMQRATKKTVLVEKDIFRNSSLELE